MATPFHVELVTPERVLYSGEAEEVSMRTDGGEISFLARHEDFIGAVDVTVVKIDLGSVDSHADAGISGATGEVRAAVHGGFVQVDGSGVTILAGVSELSDEIDVDRARRALTAAQEQAESGDGTSTQHHDDEDESASSSTSGAMQALLFPDAPEMAAKRAQARLEAAGEASTN